MTNFALCPTTDFGNYNDVHLKSGFKMMLEKKTVHMCPNNLVLSTQVPKATSNGQS